MDRTIDDFTSAIGRDRRDNELFGEKYKSRIEELEKLQQRIKTYRDQLGVVIAAAKIDDRLVDLENRLWDIRFVEDPDFLRGNKANRERIKGEAAALRKAVMEHSYDEKMDQAEGVVQLLSTHIGGLYHAAGRHALEPLRTIPDHLRRRIIEMYGSLRDDDLGLLFSQMGKFPGLMIPGARVRDSMERVLESRQSLMSKLADALREPTTRDVFDRNPVQQAFDRITKDLYRYENEVRMFESDNRNRGGFADGEAPRRLAQDNLDHFKAVLKPTPDDIEQGITNESLVYFSSLSRYRPDLTDATLAGLDQYVAVKEAHTALRLTRMGGMVLPYEWYRPIANTIELLFVFLGLTGILLAGSHFHIGGAVQLVLAGIGIPLALALAHVPLNAKVLKDKGVWMMLADSGLVGMLGMLTAAAFSAGPHLFLPTLVLTAAMAASLWLKHGQLNAIGQYTYDPSKNYAQALLTAV